MKTAYMGRLSPQSWMTAPETVKVMRALMANGTEARFVGGCVRDALANRKVIDIDIATPLKPDDVIAALTAANISYAPTGLKHGTVTAIVEGHPFEITTLRIDVNAYGRHADVRFTEDWRADAARRDFTINAMSATLEGEIFDPFGGIADLRTGRVMFVGDPEQRIREDVLRILRFFRFTAHFSSGAPDAAGLAGCTALAPLLPRLSAERVRHEILRLLEAPRAGEIWDVMLQARVVGHFLPEAMNIKTLKSLIALEESWQTGAEALRRLAALLITNAEGLAHLAEALRLSRAQAAILKGLLLQDSIPKDAAAVRRHVYQLGNDLTRSLILLAIAREDLSADKTLYDLATAFRPPSFPMVAQDVMAHGIPAGPKVGQLMKDIESWWIDEDFKPGRSACLEKLAKLIKS